MYNRSIYLKLNEQIVVIIKVRNTIVATLLARQTKKTNIGISASENDKFSCVVTWFCLTNTYNLHLAEPKIDISRNSCIIIANNTKLVSLSAML